MSGIVGLWNLDGRPVEHALLTTLSATVAHRGADGEGVWIQGPVGLACRLFRVTPEAATEIQPLVHPAGAVVVFDGRLDNRDELLAMLTASPEVSATAPDPALVLAAYETFGDRFPERLHGDFALGLFDPCRQQLLLARAAIGVRPLYYYRIRDTFLFASEIKALLAHPQVSTQPTDDILSQFLMGGLTQDNQGLTFFKGVFSLLPAHIAILTHQEFRIQQYWDFDPTRQTRLRSFQEYTEAFRHHFEQAVRRRLRSAYPVAVSVGGGLDSSAIFCLAETLRRREPERHPPLLGISYTSADGAPSDEKAFMFEIERDYGLVMERVPLRPTELLNGCTKKEVWHVEAPVLDEMWENTQALQQTAHQRGARVLLTGHWGDQMLFEQEYLLDLYRRLAWGQAWAHLKEFPRWFTDANSKWYRRRFIHSLVKCHVPDLVVSWLRRPRAKWVQARRPCRWYTEAFRKRALLSASMQTAIRGHFSTEHARSLYMEARSKHSLLYMEWQNKVAALNGLEVAFPFLDRDLISFLMGIPGEMQTYKGVPKAILREAMRGVLPVPIVERRWKADFTHLVNEEMQRQYPQLVHFFQSSMMAVRLEYVKEDVLQEELKRLKDRLYGPSCAVAWGLSDLVGFELWLQVFFGEKTN